MTESLMWKPERRPASAAAALPFALACACTLFTPATAAPQAVVTVPEQVSCATCTIRVTRVATLGSADGPGELSEPAHRVRADHAGRYWVLAGSAPPAVYAPDGRYVASVGRQGAGPGEYRYVQDVVALPGDSLLVIDPGQRRATVLDGSMRFARSVQMPTAFHPLTVLGWPGDVVAHGVVRTPDGAARTLHRLSFAAPELVVLESYEAGSGDVRQGHEWRARQIVAPARAGGWWAVEATHYRLAHRTPAGNIARQLERNAAWFTVSAGGPNGWLDTPPPAAVLDVAEDAAGLVWVAIQIPSTNWAAAWPAVPRDTREISGRAITREHLFHTMVEVIDPAQQRVVARLRLSEWAVALLPGGRLAVNRVDADGVPWVDIVSLSLVR